MKGNSFEWTPKIHVAAKGETKNFDIVFVASDGRISIRQIAKAEIKYKNMAPKILNATNFVSGRVNEPVLMSVKAIDEDNDDLTYTWKFGLFESYKAASSMQRIFTSRGPKIVKVIVSDGIDSVEQLINVNVI